MINKPVAVTYTINPYNKKMTEIKLCYISSHPDVKEKFWHTRIVQRVYTDTFVLQDLIDRYCVKYDIPFIEDINKGDRINAIQASILKKEVGVNI